MKQKQVAKPQQIIDKIEALVATQIHNGYKPGWVYHQMQNAQEKAEARGLSFYCYRELDSHAFWVATGEEDLDFLKEMLADCYEQHMEEMYG